MHKKVYCYVVIVMMAVFFCVVGAQAKVLYQNDPDSSFKTYKVQKGETWAEIAWILGVPLEKLTKWNQDVLGEQGTRNLQPGVNLKYKPPEQIEQEVKESNKKTQKKIEQNTAQLEQKVGQVEKQAKKAKKEVKKQGDDTRLKVKQESENTREKVESTGDSILQEFKGTKEFIKNKTDNLFTIFLLLLLLLAFIVIGALILGFLFFWKKRVKSSSDPDTASANEQKEGTDEQGKEKYDPDKLKKLEEQLLHPGQNEEKIRVSFKDDLKFEVLVFHDSNNGYRSWHLSSDQQDYLWFKKRNSLKKSIKESLKRYLFDQEDSQNQIEEAISKGKIKKIN